MKNNLEKEIRNIISKEFDLKKNLDKNLSPQNIDKWDSFGHLQLITKLEEYFKININQKLVIQMMDENSINKVLKKILKK
jgi:acyl carrier protein|tara:strand:- start:2120 stop:2359 length:240 start_codon:yes stop_codon:yes gene_type:complete